MRPTTLLALSHRNKAPLPARTVAELEQWYKFRDFRHFLGIYFAVSRCIRAPEDLELITREFLSGQARQNILHSEVTLTPYTHYVNYGIEFGDQLQAINEARRWAEEELGVTMSLTIDYSREQEVGPSLMVADWAIGGLGNGVSAFGLGGPEVGNPPEKFRAAFERANSAGLPCVPHAGETVGPESVWGALRTLHAARIGHGVRCMEDAELVSELRARQTPLEVCPTSNVCLKIFDSLHTHPLPAMLDEGLFVTINSDDPPMFGTTLTDEYIATADVCTLDVEVVDRLVLNALQASFLTEEKKTRLRNDCVGTFSTLRKRHL